MSPHPKSPLRAIARRDVDPGREDSRYADLADAGQRRTSGGKAASRRPPIISLDGNLRFADGRRLFGPSKTIRGAILAVLATAAGAVILGLDWRVGAIIGSMAMAGDLFSSFIKRRLGMASSSMALGLDQIPESLFPLVACRGWLSLGLVDIAVAVALFFAGEIVLSRLFFALGLRDRPY